MGNCKKQINQIPLSLLPQYFDLIALLKNTPKNTPFFIPTFTYLYLLIANQSPTLPISHTSPPTYFYLSISNYTLSTPQILIINLFYSIP